MSEDKKKELETKIRNSSGYPLFKFVGQLKKNIGSMEKKERSYFLKVALERVHELWLARFGSWEQAKAEVNSMPEPTYFQSQSLLPIQGYPCEFIAGKKKMIAITNGFTNEAYIRDFGESQVSYATAKKIFNS